MDIQLSLSLPRDSLTVPVVRHLAKHALWELNVTRDCIGDVELAITEACANVVDHAGSEEQYGVDITIDDETCAIRVTDDGQGFDVDAVRATSLADIDPGSARGRGIQLMRALVDSVEFESLPESGTVVRLVKDLEFDGAGPPFLRPSGAETATLGATDD